MKTKNKYKYKARIDMIYKRPYKVGDLVYARWVNGGELWHLSIVVGFGEEVYSFPTIALYNLATSRRGVFYEENWVSDNMRLVP